jgi:C1A family cysteine protease
MFELKLGCIPDSKDKRDYPYCLKPIEIPNRKDLSETGYDIRPVYKQNYSDCVWNALLQVIHFIRCKEKLPIVNQSRLFGYNLTRILENSLNSDCGCMIRDAIKVAFKNGVCPEDDFPYKNELLYKEPPKKAYEDALNYQTLEYRRLNNTIIQEIKNVIASGYPFLGGLMLYSGVYSEEFYKTGKLQYPSPEEYPVGGHGLSFFGYNDKVRRFFGPNSWGLDFGVSGWFSVPYDYITDSDLAMDFWTIIKSE